MSETKEEEHRETGRFYSAARSFKQLLGVMPDGTQIPGGPYTVTQFIMGLGIIVGGFLTRPAWGGDLLQDTIVIGAVAVGTVYLSGQLPSSRRNPFKMLGAVTRLLIHPRGGTYRGRPIKEALPKSTEKSPAETTTTAQRDTEKTHRMQRGTVNMKAKKTRRNWGKTTDTHQPSKQSGPVTADDHEIPPPAGHPSLGRLRASLGLTDQH